MKEELIGRICDGHLSVRAVTPEAGGRGTARVELSVYGARYPYKLRAADVHELIKLLESGATRLTAPVQDE